MIKMKLFDLHIEENIQDFHHLHRYLHHLQKTAKDLTRTQKNTDQEKEKDKLKILQQQLLLPLEMDLAFKHSQNHLTSMKHKVIGDVKIVEIGILLSAHIAIVARLKNLGKQLIVENDQVDITMIEMIRIIVVVIEAQIIEIHNMTDIQIKPVIMIGDNNTPDRMVEVIDHITIGIDHMREEIQGRDQDRMIDTTIAEVFVMIEILIEDLVLNKKVV